MRLAALLRAVNVGGRTVKMDRLRTLFEGDGFTGVETFIASGNVIFETRSKPGASLERAIEAMLRDALGFEVATFLRTCAELPGIAGREPFPAAAVKRSLAFNVAFLRQPPDARAVKALMARRTATDEIQLHGRELYWLSGTKQSEAIISNAVFEKILGQPSTMRGISTIRKMAERYGS